MRILLVEDDETLAAALVETLTAQYYAVDLASDGEMGWEYVQVAKYDLIVLDLNLPHLDGIQLCQRLRQHQHHEPVLILAAQSSSRDKVRGLDAGADDYITKPCSMDELLARVRALLRRQEPTLRSPVITWGEFCLNPTACEITFQGKLLALTPKEYSLLELFLRNPSRVFSGSVILEHIWAFDDAPGQETVRAHIKRLRRKLKLAGGGDIIETIYGIGYRLNDGAAAASPALETGATDASPTGMIPAPDGQVDAPVPPIAEPESKPEVKLESASESIAGSSAPPDAVTVNESMAMADQARSMARLAWERFREPTLERVTLLEQAVAALEAAACSEALLAQAQQTAHKLAGSLGMFGFPEGSALAQALERLLKGDQPEANVDQLEALVVRLRERLHQPPTQDAFSLSGVPSDRRNNGTARSDGAEPHLQVANSGLPDSGLLAAVGRKRVLVVDTEGAIAPDFYALVHSAGLEIERVTTLEQARQVLSQNMPDGVLIDPAIAPTIEAGLAFLGELADRFPSLPVFTYSAQDSQSDRLAVVRHRGRTFLSKALPPSQVVQVILQALDPLMQPAQPTVLAVDDDPVILDRLTQLLPKWGIQVVPLADTKEFWNALSVTLPDLLILDIEMPHANGIELCQIVRNDSTWSSLPILFLSSRHDAETIHTIYHIGADDYVHKPFTEPELVARIFNRLERNRLLKNLAEMDQLTGLLNRHYGINKLKHYLQLSLRYQQEMNVVILDIDQFRYVNDEYGYDWGDRVLQWLAHLVKQVVRSGDITARCGGDELMIGLYCCSQADALLRISQLLQLLRLEEFQHPTQPGSCQITFSAGIAAFPKNGSDFPSLYRAANQALQQAKSRGGNHIELA
ncbi:MAG: response regulator [Synechococcales bacterium]|nr:response regulator [Synechococcales bacterium]